LLFSTPLPLDGSLIAIIYIVGQKKKRIARSWALSLNVS
jgi:hypothetical protein